MVETQGMLMVFPVIVMSLGRRDGPNRFWRLQLMVGCLIFDTYVANLSLL